MPGQHRRDLADEGVLGGVEPRPFFRHGAEDFGPAFAAFALSGAGGVLPGEAEDEAHQGGGGVELRRLGHAERLNPPAKAFQDPQRRVLPGIPGELPAYPGVGVDGVEDPEGQGADRVLGVRLAGGVLHAYIALSRSSRWFGRIDFADAAARARIAAEFEGWAPALTALLTDGEAAPVWRPLYTLPADHRWARVPGVTLLGDAAHLAPPAGEGANLALLDGAELGAVIAAHPGDPEAAFASYEAAMFPRGRAGAVAAHRILKLLCCDDRVPASGRRLRDDPAGCD